MFPVMPERCAEKAEHSAASGGYDSGLGCVNLWEPSDSGNIDGTHQQLPRHS